MDPLVPRRLRGSKCRLYLCVSRPKRRRRRFGPPFCLQAPDDEQGVCIIADSAGIAAVAVERHVARRDCYRRARLARSRGAAATSSCASAATRWSGTPTASAARPRPPRARRTPARARPPLSRAQARVVRGIDAYYARARARAGRARLPLDPREAVPTPADLYLFELLQNAVDDGARTIRVDACARTGGLTLRHDGRRFSPLDALGLASVGLSTKGSASGGRRTIGFMGVGFKAVYKRFARVVVRDRSFRFAFDEATTTGAAARARTRTRG